MNNIEKNKKNLKLAIKEYIYEDNNYIGLKHYLNKYNVNLSYKIENLIEFFKINEREENLKCQELYKFFLDKIVMSISKFNYEKNKENFKFNNIASLDIFIKDLFKKDLNPDKITLYFYKYVNGESNNKEYIKKEYINKEINRLYSLYKRNCCTHEESISFYNEILNDFQNRYENEYRRYLESTIKDKLNILDKKKNSIFTGKKLKKIKKIIKEEKFEEINTTKDELCSMLIEYRNEIKNIKDIKTSKIKLSSSDFIYFEKMFLKNGEITIKDINQKIDDDKICKIICEKYNKFKLKFIKYIILSKNEEKISYEEKEKLEYDYNNYKFFDKERFIDNLVEFVLQLDDNIIQRIFNNDGFVFEKAASLLIFSNLTNDFTTSDVINILSYYDESKNEIENNNNIKYPDTYSFIYNNFDKLLYMGKTYTKVDALAEVILSKKVINEIGKTEINDYLALYLKSFNRISSTIPKIYYETSKYTFSSGELNNDDKLLVGYINSSCIKLNNLAGKDTLIKVMLDENCDAILIRDKNKDLVARMLIFRLGNVVLLAPMVTRYYNKEEILTYDFLESISNQILDKAKENNDSIDFIFISGENSHMVKCEYEEIIDPRFNKLFPHADLYYKANLIKSSENINSRNLIKKINFKKEVKYYKRERGKIIVNKNEDELTKIKALSIKFEKDELLKDELTSKFCRFNVNEYKYTISGDDWYIALRNDGEIEETIIDTIDSRTREEFELAKRNILQTKNL